MKKSNYFKIKLAIACLILTAGLFSCKKDNSNKVAGSQVSFSVRADNAFSAVSASTTAVNSTTTIPAITWTAGIANINRFKLEVKAGNIEKEFQTRGLTNVDLFAIDPSLISTDIDTGTFTKIEVKLEFVKSNTSAIPLMLTGSFTKADGTTIPVELNVNQDFEIKAEANSLFIDNTTSLQTNLILHLNRIFQSVRSADFEKADQSSGKIIISSSSNTALFNIAISNLKNLGEAEFHGEHEHHHGADDNGGDDHGNNSGHGSNENDG